MDTYIPVCCCTEMHGMEGLSHMQRSVCFARLGRYCALSSVHRSIDPLLLFSAWAWLMQEGSTLCSQRQGCGYPLAGHLRSQCVSSPTIDRAWPLCLQMSASACPRRRLEMAIFAPRPRYRYVTSTSLRMEACSVAFKMQAVSLSSRGRRPTRDWNWSGTALQDRSMAGEPLWATRSLGIRISTAGCSSQKHPRSARRSIREPELARALCPNVCPNQFEVENERIVPYAVPARIICRH
jgi:hypothetical protein